MEIVYERQSYDVDYLGSNIWELTSTPQLTPGDTFVYAGANRLQYRYLILDEKYLVLNENKVRAKVKWLGRVKS